MQVFCYRRFTNENSVEARLLLDAEEPVPVAHGAIEKGEAQSRGCVRPSRENVRDGKSVAVDSSWSFGKEQLTRLNKACNRLFDCLGALLWSAQAEAHIDAHGSVFVGGNSRGIDSGPLCPAN